MKLYDNDSYRDEFMEIVYDLLASDETNDRANQIIDAFDTTPEIEAEPLPPNAPLTLEELREMDGEPVWVVTGSAINAGRGFWDICDWWDKNTVMFPYSGEQPRVDDYGITWTAYRRKPEEVSP